MKGYLNKNRIAYILRHLSHHYEIPGEIEKKFCFVKDTFNSFTPGKIYFRLSPAELKMNKIKYVNEIPVLFPLTEEKYFYIHKDNYLVFSDDLLKSAFFLLSGYQEIISEKKDAFDRFPFEESIQSKLKIIKKPVVNYYFQMLIDGINLFTGSNNPNYKIQTKRLFKDFGFILSHDVDRIKLYTFNSILYKLKQITGFTENPYSLITAVYLLCLYIFMTLNPFAKDPYWNFKEINSFEKKMNIRSVWFFLNKNQKYIDSFYSFKDKRIKKLIRFLISQNHEIGLHGTVEASYNSDHLSYLRKMLSKIADCNITGIRQHRLSFRMPDSFKIQTENEFKYDSSMGFASHEGFRNSYCYPYNPYDFDNETHYKIWEIPLNVMDSTLFYYRKLTLTEAKTSIFEIINEIKKYGGIFNLLWHNHYFDEYLMPGIKNFYEELIKEILSMDCENILPYEIISKKQI